MYWNRQKVKLISVISVVLITGFLVTSLSSYFVARTALRSEISENELPLTSDNIYSEIQRDLLRPVFISSLMAADTFLRDWVLTGEKGEEQITRYLKEIQNRYNTFTSFFVSEKTRIYYHGDSILKKVSPEEKRDQWYFRVRELEDEYEINVDPDLANKDEMTIFINYKVFDYAGNYIGATGVGLTVNAVKSLLEMYQDKYNRTIYFLDAKGDVKLASSGFDNRTAENFLAEGPAYFRKALESKADQGFSYKKDGQVVHTNIRYIQEFQWYLVVEQSEREIIANIRHTLLINLLILAVILVIVVFFVNVAVNAYQKRIETLRGIVPICSFCKQIRDDKGYWNRVEAYVAKYTDAQFSHSICPDCIKKHYPEASESMEKEED